MWTELLLRTVLSGLIAMAMYGVAASVVHRLFPRTVARSVLRHDVRLGLISLAFGSPVIQVFAFTAHRFGFTRLYENIGDKGWPWWLVSLPLYVLCWDLVFYLTHLVLHWPLVFRLSHFRHHSCRPPVAWSGISIDPLETVLSGILPYTVPVFFFPFHVYTVYALNIVLMIWAFLVHSSLNWSGNAVFMTTKDHNLHHTFGLRNCNYAAVVTFWDRMFGTLDRAQTPPWWGKRAWVPRVGVATVPAPGPSRGESEAAIAN